MSLKGWSGVARTVSRHPGRSCLYLVLRPYCALRVARTHHAAGRLSNGWRATPLVELRAQLEGKDRASQTRLEEGPLSQGAR